MALILDRRQKGDPGVHVILIGVGTFANARAADLLGDDAPKGGFADLETPLHSVEAFAGWLQTELDVADTPLQTLRVLASSASRTSRLGVTSPTFKNIADEVGEWSDDVDSHEDNLAIFYFCGHGLLIGETQLLLAEDFGSNRRAPFEDSIEPELLANAMRQMQGRRQLFLIDACSTEVPFSRRYANVRSRTIVQEAQNQNLAKSEQCLIRASKLGSRAFGSATGPSVFMDAFLRAMKGAGAVSAQRRRWVIHTDMLKLALSWLMQLRPEGQGQEVSFGGGTLSSNVSFHMLSGDPLVPVRVLCEPRELEAVSALHVDSAQHSAAGNWPESFDIERRAHDFEAIETTAEGAKVHGQVLQEVIAPPFVNVYIPC
ncbi:caspase family protein [Caballeronia novacaledonica]|uniref:Caspase family protein n=1 Tax=Caballeronia novacaledonica TaxID=1544861 RepID=A0ACB5R220_9BURK|nr:caspase family protein [Caballeronia sp. NK8]BCQ30046.1 caspase family protein [Caballeronia sp. NK8]GJH21456.1 caspase family protein [Caballeronia novacaledonica]